MQKSDQKAIDIENEYSQLSLFLKDHNVEIPESQDLDTYKMIEMIFEKNNPEKGGSFYLQSKVYFAKEHLMQDFPPEFNKS